MEFINFNEHIKARKLNVYNGSEKKRTVILSDNNQYLLKFPDPVREVNRSISYINNAISEYIGCKIFKQVGFHVQDVVLGRFIDENGKEKIACACKDIRKDGEILHEAEQIALEFLEKQQMLSFAAVKNILDSLDGFNADVAFQEFCNRFIIDAFIGNTDRHNGNWGIIESRQTLELAAVYDCGSSLSPLYTDEELTDFLVKNQALNVKSILCSEDSKRIRYRDFLLSGENPNINKALKIVVPKINLEDIYSIIREIPYISEKRKEFYITLLDIRYNQILLPALENVLSIKKSEEYKKWNSTIIKNIYSDYLQKYCVSPDAGCLFFQDTNGFSKQLNFKKAGDVVFFFQDTDECVGLAKLTYSNLNICKFVQSARNMGMQIDSAIEKYKTNIQLDNNNKLNFDL